MLFLTLSFTPAAFKRPVTIPTEETIHPDMCNELVKEYMDKINWTQTIYK